MWLVVLGIAVALGCVVFSRAKHDFTAHGHLSMATFVALLLMYLGHVGLLIVSAFWRVWPMTIHSSFALVAGAATLTVGLFIYLRARLEFGSFRLAWGLTTGRLVTTGIYAYSRNPQIIGATLTYLGIALLGRSNASIVLTGAFLVGSLFWIPVEEQCLESAFGEEYLHYRQRVARIFSLPGRGPAA